MKEKMIKILKSEEWKQHSYYNSEENYHIENFIEYFFDQYQPERLNPEDDKIIWSSVLDEYPYKPIICDSLNSENK